MKSNSWIIENEHLHIKMVGVVASNMNHPEWMCLFNSAHYQIIYVCERVDCTRTVCCFIIYDLHLFGKCSYKIQLWIDRKEGNFSRWKIWMWCRENNSHEISISWMHIKYNHKCEFDVVSIECVKKCFVEETLKKLFCIRNSDIKVVTRLICILCI